MKYPIDFFVAFSKSLLPQFLNLKIGLLHFLQLEPHTINIGQIRSLNI